MHVTVNPPICTRCRHVTNAAGVRVCVCFQRREKGRLRVHHINNVNRVLNLLETNYNVSHASLATTRWGTAHAEIKILSAENRELSTILSLKPGAGQKLVWLGAYTARNFCISKLCLPRAFDFFFFFSFFFFKSSSNMK